jgi:hypothetical protein
MEIIMYDLQKDSGTTLIMSRDSMDLALEVIVAK